MSKKKRDYHKKPISQGKIISISVNRNNICNDYSTLELRFDPDNNEYTQRIGIVMDNILKYNIKNKECKLILCYNQLSNTFEICSHINKLCEKVTYITTPVFGTFKSRTEKYGLKFDYMNKKWFSYNFSKYKELKEENNLKIIEMHKKRQENLR